MMIIVYISIALILLYFLYSKTMDKSRLTNDNMKKLRERASQIKHFLNENHKVPTFNEFKRYFPDTDMAEWADIKMFTEKTSEESIFKAIS
jgi:hypothetical protein